MYIVVAFLLSLAVSTGWFCTQPLQPTSTIIVKRVSITNDDVYSFLSTFEAWNANIVAIQVDRLSINVLASIGVDPSDTGEELLAHVTQFAKDGPGYKFGPRSLQSSSSGLVEIDGPLNSLGRLYVYLVNQLGSSRPFPIR